METTRFQLPGNGVIEKGQRDRLRAFPRRLSLIE
jgi:hypothetical protein